jgi:diketogulonate reductase-like aldo/keto reductase
MKYKARGKGKVDEANFKKIRGINNDLEVSRLAYGTLRGNSTKEEDFLMYNAMKISLMSGGINHIDTGHAYRK